MSTLKNIEKYFSLDKIIIETLQAFHFISTHHSLQCVLKHLDSFQNVFYQFFDLLFKFLYPFYFVVVIFIVKLFGDQIYQFIIIVVAESEDLLEVSTLVIMDNILLFKAHNGLPNCLNIFIQNFALENFIKFWKLIHNFHPVTFPY